jgi:hypothetical protein
MTSGARYLFPLQWKTIRPTKLDAGQYNLILSERADGRRIPYPAVRSARDLRTLSPADPVFASATIDWRYESFAVTRMGTSTGTPSRSVAVNCHRRSASLVRL